MNLCKNIAAYPSHLSLFLSTLTVPPLSPYSLYLSFSVSLSIISVIPPFSPNAKATNGCPSQKQRKIKKRWPQFFPHRCWQSTIFDATTTTTTALATALATSIGKEGGWNIFPRAFLFLSKSEWTRPSLAKNCFWPFWMSSILIWCGFETTFLLFKKMTDDLHSK